MSDSETDIRLRPAVPEDRFLIRRWLAEPEIAGLVGQCGERGGRDHPGDGERRPRSAASSSATGAPIGYAHAVEIGLWAEERPQASCAPGTWDVDLFIGSGSSTAAAAWAASRWPC